MKGKLVQGFGINNSDGIVTWRVDGKKLFCPYYTRWKGALTRCNNTDGTTPTYDQCFMSDSWKFFTDFRDWAVVASHGNPAGLDLDKDILYKGNKEYGPNTCCFVPAYVNRILVDNRARRGQYPLGISYSPKTGRAISERLKPYRADLSTQSGVLWLGNFKTPEEAHKVWQWSKAEHMEQVVSKYSKEVFFNTFVADALTDRIWKLRLDHSLGFETKTI